VLNSIKTRLTYPYRKGVSLIKARPLLTFFSLLLILFLLVVVGNSIRKASVKPAKEAPKVAKAVEIYVAGGAPKVRVNAQIEKSGVTKISALTGGIVTKVSVTEGKKVNKGAQLMILSNTYNGSSAPVIQRQLADKQYESATLTFNSQKEIIAKQKDAAEKSEDSAVELREITRKSLDETRDLIKLNDEIITNLNTTIEGLQASSSAESVQALQQARSAKAQVQAGLNQLRSGLRNAEYQTDEDKAAADLPELQKDIAVKQLELQEKSLAVAVDVAKLQVQLAKIGESALYPSTPITGVVERIHVREGDSVQPGTLLATLSGGADSIKAVALVSKDIASKVSLVDDSQFISNGETFSERPIHVSTEATNGQLYSVIYSVDSSRKSLFSDDSTVVVDIPLGFAMSSDPIVYVPLDAIYQTQDSAYVFVKEGNVARSRTIQPGSVFGSYVMIRSGLKSGDQIIVNRNVVNGDTVE
jgi:multidrug efflux pump subunit AcrA (membrane-fusion protein)